MTLFTRCLLCFVVLLSILAFYGCQEKEKKDYAVKTNDIEVIDTTRSNTSKIIIYPQLNVIDGKIFFSDSVFDIIKYQIDLSCDKQPKTNWDLIRTQIHNTDTLYLKENCSLHLKGYSSTDSLIQSAETIISFSFDEMLMMLIATHDSRAAQMFEVNPTMPLSGTKLYINGKREQALAYRGEDAVNCARNNGIIVKIERERNHTSVLDPIYPKILELQIKNK